MNKLKTHVECAVIVGDNMKTDIRAGVQAGIETILVLSGVSRESELDRYAYRPNRIFPSVAEIQGLD